MGDSDLLHFTLQAMIYIFSMVAATALFVYDYCLTWPKEVEYVWRTRWTAGKGLFIAMRYLLFLELPLRFMEAFLPGPTMESCHFIVYCINVSTLVGILLADLAIGLRTWAIWNRTVISGAIASMGWVASLSIGVYSLVSYDMQASHLPLTARVVKGIPCLLRHCGRYSLVIFVGTAIRGYTHFRQRPAQLTTVLFADAFVSSIGLCGSAMLGVALVYTAPYYGYGWNNIDRVLKTILPCRIILNIREAALQLDNWDVTKPDHASSEDDEDCADGADQELPLQSMP